MVASGWRNGAVAAAVLVLCLLGGMLRTDDTVAVPSAAACLLGGVAAALLLLRHRSPLVAMAGATACGMLGAPAGLLVTPLTTAPVVVCAYTLARRDEWRATTGTVLACSALLVVPVLVFENDLSWADTSRLVTVAAAPLVGAVLGRLAGQRHAYLALVEERARRAEEARDSEARRMVAEERVRIARELHDLVAHRITLANAQANVASHLFDRRPDEARDSVEELVRTTRHALDELRATVGLLRRPEDDAAPPEPAPGLVQLPALVESFGRAGLAVTVQHGHADRGGGGDRPDDTAGVLPPALDLTAYRIVQEALTNVAKHAGADSAHVRLAWSTDALEIAVGDDGPGRPPASAPGYGLIGMRERAAAVGGELVAGPRPDGGFLVTARLPLDAPAGAPAPASASAADTDHPHPSEDR